MKIEAFCNWIKEMKEETEFGEMECNCRRER